MPKHAAARPDWELVLSSAARLQRILPDAVLVGGTASAIHAGQRFSNDADHVLTDFRYRFDEVLAQLESVAGWKTARVQQLQVQLANALPYDLKEAELDEYRNLQPRWQDWQTVKATCAQFAIRIFDRVCAMNAAS